MSSNVTSNGVAATQNDAIAVYWDTLPGDVKTFLKDLTVHSGRNQRDLIQAYKTLYESPMLAKASPEQRHRFARLSIGAEVARDPSLRPLPHYRIYPISRTEARIAKVDERVNGVATGRKVAKPVRDIVGIGMAASASSGAPFFAAITAWGDAQVAETDAIALNRWYDVGLVPVYDKKSKVPSKTVRLNPTDASKWSEIDAPGLNPDTAIASLLPLVTIPDTVRHFGQTVRIRAMVTDVVVRPGMANYQYRISDDAFAMMDIKVQAQVGNLSFFAHPSEGVGGAGTEVELLAQVQRVERSATAGYTPHPLQEVQLKTYSVRTMGFSAPLPTLDADKDGAPGLGDDLPTDGLG